MPKHSWQRRGKAAMDLIEFFSNHVFRMVFFGTTVIGIVSGALGAFAYLRKQSLISDVIGHAALPGALLAFLMDLALRQLGKRAFPWTEAGL